MGLLAAQALLWLSVVAMRRNTAYLSIVFCFGGARRNDTYGVYRIQACGRVDSGCAP